VQRKHYLHGYAIMKTLNGYLTLDQAISTVGISRRMMYNHFEAGTAPPFEKFNGHRAFPIGPLLNWKAEHYPNGKLKRGRRPKFSIKPVYRKRHAPKA
jgi:predicted DNA-binding transcriptional regulator AlpA